MNWSHDEFLGYLLIHASYADGTFSPIERQLILQKIGDEIFHKAMADYSFDTLAVKHDKIAKYLQANYKTFEEKQELLSLLKRQFLSDTEFSKEEQKLLVRLQELM